MPSKPKNVTKSKVQVSRKVKSFTSIVKQHNQKLKKVKEEKKNVRAEKEKKLEKDLEELNLNKE